MTTGYFHSTIFLFDRENLSFYFSLYFEGSPHQKIPRELSGGGDPAIFLCSHGKIFWWDRSGKFKNTRRKGTDQENSKKQGKKKERFFHSWKFPYSSVLVREGRTCTRAVTSPTTYWQDTKFKKYIWSTCQNADWILDKTALDVTITFVSF